MRCPATGNKYSSGSMPGKQVTGDNNNNNTPNENKKTQQLTVVVRIRPACSFDEEKKVVVHKVDEKMVVLSDPVAGDPVDVLRAKRAHDKNYVFDWAFDGTSTQKEVYEKTTRKLVENVLEGYNGTVFAYGATGSGKTYTMVGTNEDPGIMVRALTDLFLEVDKEHASFDVTMSYLEIYNEAIRDLLTASPGHLELREDAKGNHQVVGLSETKIASSEQVMSLLTRGNRQRTQEATGANRTSSRSHALLIVRVKRKTKSRDHRQQVRTGSLYMVDLAGSERAANTQNTGKRLVEGAHINKSLLALGNCINALAERHVRYVNFRDSKLTRLLKEPLTGNCRTVMVAHVSPDGRHYEETRNTLVYADRAKNITTKLRSNVSDVSYHVAQYQVIIKELRQEIDTLREKIRERGPDSETSSCSSATSEMKEEKRLSEAEMKELKERLIESFNMQMEVRRRMMEIDSTLLGQSIEFDKLSMILNEWETEKAVTAIDVNDSSESVRRSSCESKSSGSSVTSRTNSDDLPEHIRQAWDDMQYLKSQQARYLQMREDCQADYETCKENTHRVTESLPDKKASSQEQRELLHLLARVYELEVEKLELQASQLVREHELRYRDLMLRRYDRQRQLCDDIITRQRQLIDAMSSSGKDKNEFARRELNELYRIYQQELHELASGRDSRLFGNGSKPGSAHGLRPLGTSGSMLELHQIGQNGADEKPLPPIPLNNNGEGLDEEKWLFQRRKAPPVSQQVHSDWAGSKRPDSSEWSVKSHSSSDSSRVLPPLDKPENSPKTVGETAAATSKGKVAEKNSRNGSIYSSSSSPSTSSDKSTLAILQSKQNDHRGMMATGASRKEDIKREPFGEECVELRHPVTLTRSFPKRYGLLPSLKPNTGCRHPPTNKIHDRLIKGTASSDSEVSNRNRYNWMNTQFRLPYQNQVNEPAPPPLERRYNYKGKYLGFYSVR